MVDEHGLKRKEKKTHPFSFIVRLEIGVPMPDSIVIMALIFQEAAESAFLAACTCGYVPLQGCLWMSS